MAKQKDMTDAQIPADKQPKAAGADQPPAGDAPADEAHLAGDRGASAAADAAEHAPEPDGAVDGHGLVELVTEEKGDGEEPAGGFSETGGQAVNDSDGSADGPASLAGDTDRADAGGKGFDGGNPVAADDRRTDAGGDERSRGEDEAHDGRDDVLRNHGDVGAGEEENHLDNPALAPLDGIVQAAEEAVSAWLFYLVEFYEFDEDQRKRLHIMAGGEDSRATNAMAEFIRLYGAKVATPNVLCHQLRILGLVERSEPSPVEELLAHVFLSVIAGTAWFEAKEAERQAVADRLAPARRPVPLDETAGELVDGPMEIGRD